MNAKIRTLSTILLVVSMLVSCMPFGALAENEPATPTDLAPIGEEIQGETGTGETENIPDTEIPAGEEPTGEQTIPEDPAGEEASGEEVGEENTAGEGTDGEGSSEEGTEGNPAIQLPELRYGKTGYRGTLKAGEEFRIVLRPEYSWNILVTLVLNSKAGNTLDAASVRMCLNGAKKNPVRIENEDPESTGITLQFGAYTAKDSEYILSITSPVDADFILTAVKRPEAEPEETGSEDGNEEHTIGEEETEVEDDDEDGEAPADNTENEATAAPETAEEPETPEPEAEVPGEEETKVEEPAVIEEQPTDENGAEKSETEIPEEMEDPEDEPVKNEPATPTDLAPAAGGTQEQPVSETGTTDSKKETEKKETKDKEAEEDKELLPPAEELLALGWYGSQVAMTTGADIFESTEEGAEPVDHLEPGAELWLRQTEDEIWAEIYCVDDKAPARYIRWDDVIITLKPEPEEAEEEEDPLPARSVEVTSTLWGMLSIPFGTEITMTGELINFRADDICTFQWQYRTEDSDTFIDIDGANEQTYTYQINRENYSYIWRLTVLVKREE